MSSYTIQTDSRVLHISDAETAEEYSKQGYKVTARAGRKSYLGDSDE